MTLTANDVTVAGFAMQYASNGLQSGAFRFAPGTTGGVLRDCDLSGSTGGAAAAIGSASYSTIDSCAIHDNFEEGIHAGRDEGTGLTSSHGVGNVLSRLHVYNNNPTGTAPGWECGGMKATLQQGLQILDSEFDHNIGPGIWLDIYNQDTLVSGNRLHDNSRNGLHDEVSFRTRATGNAVWANGFAKSSWGWGAGILSSSSTGGEYWGNTLAWNADGIAVISADRQDWPLVKPYVNVSVHDNVVAMNPQTTDTSDKFGLGWLQDWAGPLFDPASNNHGAANAYWWPTAENGSARFGWNGNIGSLTSFNATPGEEGGRYLSDAEKDAVLAAAGIP
jgi:hypothetical protein